MKGHKALKQRRRLVLYLFVLVAAFVAKGWMETTMDTQQASDTIFTEEWWQTIETPQIYTYTVED